MLEISKARLSALVLFTALVGFLAAPRTGLEAWPFVGMLLGTLFAAFGANALNECIEVDRDRHMRRTRNRPLPAGELSRPFAWTYAAACSIVGPLVLWLTAGLLPAALAAASLLLYVAAYTPMKTRTPSNTLVGAVVGAIPPMIGWTAATGSLDVGAWLLAGVLFVWQVPHFLALAWIYRDDYRRGGFRMLPVVDPTGLRTGHTVVLYSLTLVPATLAPVLVGVAGPYYAIGAVLLGIVFVALAARLYFERSVASARRVFLASVIYLPILLGLMLADPGTPSGWPAMERSAQAAQEQPAPPPPADLDLAP